MFLKDESQNRQTKKKKCLLNKIKKFDARPNKNINEEAIA
jgi:hypothetical protein